MKHLKQEFDRLTLKELVVLWLSVVCMICAIVAIFLGMYIEPAGEIHASVLTYFGISSAFCGSLLGISAHYSNELHKFKSEAMNFINNKSTPVT